MNHFKIQQVIWNILILSASFLSIAWVTKLIGDWMKNKDSMVYTVLLIMVILCQSSFLLSLLRKIERAGTKVLSSIVLICVISSAITVLFYETTSKYSFTTTTILVSSVFAIILSVLTSEPPTDHEYPNVTFDQTSLNIANALICKVKNDNIGITIGLSGAWGIGKTTLLSYIKAELHSDNKIVHVIDSRNFLSSSNLVDFLKEKFIDIFFTGKDALSQKEIEAWLTNNDKTSALSPLASIVFETPSQNEVTKHIKDLLKGSKKSHVIIYDDLDRLSKEELTTILRLSNRINGIPGITQIFSYDRRIVEKIFAATQSTLSQSFLAKYINYEFHLPSLVADNALLATETKLKKMMDTDFFNPYINTHRGPLSSDFFKLLDNHREIDMFIEALRSLLVSANYCVYLPDAVNMTILKIKFPFAYASLQAEIEPHLNRGIDISSGLSNTFTDCKDLLLALFPTVLGASVSQNEVKIFRAHDPVYFPVYFSSSTEEKKIFSIIDYNYLKSPIELPPALAEDHSRRMSVGIRMEDSLGNLMLDADGTIADSAAILNFYYVVHAYDHESALSQVRAKRARHANYKDTLDQFVKITLGKNELTYWEAIYLLIVIELTRDHAHILLLKSKLTSEILTNLSPDHLKLFLKTFPYSWPDKKIIEECPLESVEPWLITHMFALAFTNPIWGLHNQLKTVSKEILATYATRLQHQDLELETKKYLEAITEVLREMEQPGPSK